MLYRMIVGCKDTIGRTLIVAAAVLPVVPFALRAQDLASTSDFNPEDVTFSRDNRADPAAELSELP